MLLHDARRDARVGPAGDLVLLEDQDRSRWDAGRRSRKARRSSGPSCRLVAWGRTSCRPPSRPSMTKRRMRRAPTGPRSPSFIARSSASIPRRSSGSTTRSPSSFADGPAVGLAMMDGLTDEGALASYPYLHAARADLLRRLGRRSEAASRVPARPGAHVQPAGADLSAARLREVELEERTLRLVRQPDPGPETADRRRRARPDSRGGWPRPSRRG